MANAINFTDYEKYSNLSDEELYSLPTDEVTAIYGQMQAHEQALEQQRAALAAEGYSQAEIEQLEEALRTGEARVMAEEAESTPSGAPVGIGGPSPSDFAGDAGKGGAAVLEGVKRTAEGVADLAEDISVGVGSILPTGASEYLEMTPEHRAAWKQGVANRRLRDEIEFAERYGTLTPGGARMVGEVAPWLAANASAGGLIGYALRGAFLGGAAGTSTFQDQGLTLNDRTSAALWGTGLGALVGGVAGIPGALRGATARHLVRDFNAADPRQREMVESMVQAMADPDFKFSAAQLTGARFYQSLELRTVDRATKAQQNKNIDALYNNLLRMARAQSDRKMGAGAIVAGIRTTLKTFRDRMYAQATANWGTKAKQIVETYGDDAVVNGRAYLAKVDKLVAEKQNGLIQVGAKPSDNLINYRDRVDTIVNPWAPRTYERTIKGADGKKTTVKETFLVNRSTGEKSPKITGKSDEEIAALAEKRAAAMNEVTGPNAKNTLDLLKGLNDLIGGDAMIFENASLGQNRQTGRALMGAFTAELEASTAGSDDLVRDIMALRKGYQQDMAATQAVGDSLFASILGGKKAPKKPGKVLDRILAEEYDDVKALADFLRDENPALLQDVRRVHLRRIALRSRNQARPDVDSPVDIGLLAKNLSNSMKEMGGAGRGLHTSGVQGDMELTAKALRILQNKQFKGIVPGGISPEDWTINLISRSPEFFGRFITRIFASGKNLEELLLNPEWRQALRVVAEQPLESEAGKAALLFLAVSQGRREAAVAAEEQRAAEELAAKGFKGSLGD